MWWAHCNSSGAADVTKLAYPPHGAVQDNGVKEEYGLTAEGACQAEAAG